MEKDQFVNLHVHSEGSLLDGYSTVEEYVKEVKNLNQVALGLTDHGNLHTMYEFITMCNKNNINPIPGCELYVAPQNPLGAKAKEPIFYGNENQRNYDVSSRGAYLHLTVWAYNQEGLKNLNKLSSASHLEENFYKKPRVDLEMINEFSKGLVVATGCPSSEISTRFNLGQDKEAYDYVDKLVEIFGKDRVFVEVMNHNMDNDLERRILPKLYKLSQDLGLKLIATNDSHYARAEDCSSHEELLCVQSNAYMDDKPYDEGGRRFAFNGREYYLKDSKGMRSILPKQLHEGIRNTLIVAEMAQDINLNYKSFLRPSPVGLSEDEQLVRFKRLVEEGFREKFGNASEEEKIEVRQKINYEMETIIASDFIGYFLTVYDYLKHSRETYSVRDKEGNIVASANGPGRGSVGGFLIAYLLGISAINPLTYKLISERFISNGRGATYEILYSDGSRDIKVASDTFALEGVSGKKYVHQLKKGDIVISEN